MSRRRRVTGTSATGYWLTAPYLVLLAAFGIGPTIYAVYLSVVDNYSGTFVGFDNYANAFTDYRFLPALGNVGAYMAIWLPFMAISVLLISLVLQAHPGRFTGSMRLLYYLPGAFTGSAAVLLWIFILDPSIGPFAWILGLGDWQYISDVVTNARLPLIYALMAFTSGAGGWIVIMYGALNNVGSDVVEAARIDGANGLQLALLIKIPLIGKYIVYMLILCFSAGAQLFAEPLIFGPTLGVGNSTWSLNLLAFVTGIREGDTGSSSALSLTMLLVGVLTALVLIFRTDFFDTKVMKR
jgi:multiple sugar transport system permease protein